MAHLVKYLLYKHENLSSILRIHIEKAIHIFVVPGFGFHKEMGGLEGKAERGGDKELGRP